MRKKRPCQEKINYNSTLNYRILHVQSPFPSMAFEIPFYCFLVINLPRIDIISVYFIAIPPTPSHRLSSLARTEGDQTSEKKMYNLKDLLDDDVIYDAVLDPLHGI